MYGKLIIKINIVKTENIFFDKIKKQVWFYSILCREIR